VKEEGDQEQEAQEEREEERVNRSIEKPLAEKDEERSGDEEKQDQKDIGRPLLQDDIDIHQPMFHDGVTDEADHDQSGGRAQVAQSGGPKARQDEIERDGGEGRDKHADERVLDLEALQADRMPQRMDQEKDSSPDVGQKVDRKGLIGEAMAGHQRVPVDGTNHQRSEREDGKESRKEKKEGHPPGTDGSLLLWKNQRKVKEGGRDKTGSYKTHPDPEVPPGRRSKQINQ
jgi:hypothetical protein